MGVDIARLREMPGLQITGLMGMDIIGKYSVVFDYPSMQVHFEDDPMLMDGTILHMPTFVGVTMTRVNIHGVVRYMCLAISNNFTFLYTSIRTVAKNATV
jgi:hypothetical protein